MDELSLHILDIAVNSIRARAKKIKITIEQEKKYIKIVIEDDGYGMDNEILKVATNPFYTSRTTRKVGLGLSMYKMAAEMTGGEFSIDSKKDLGTKVVAKFNQKNIDCMPLGDVVSTITTLLGSEDDFDLEFKHILPFGKIVDFNTSEIKKILDGVKISEPEVILWCESYLKEQYK